MPPVPGQLRHPQFPAVTAAVPARPRPRAPTCALRARHSRRQRKLGGRRSWSLSCFPGGREARAAVSEGEDGERLLRQPGRPRETGVT